MQREETSRFGFGSTAAEVAAGVDLAGKVIVVTGGSGGLGAESARVLGSRGAHVMIGARDLAKAEGVADTIRASGGGAEVESLELASLPSVRRFAESVRAKHPKIDVLLNNAGVMACPLARTEQGFELQFGTNHLGHFLLTGLLLPSLRAAAPSRIVCLSSSGHRFAPVDLADPDYEKRPYEKWEAYGQAKTANIWHALELDRREGERSVRAFAVHPGMIVTELGRHLTDDDRKALLARVAAAAKASGGETKASPGARWKSVEQGAATQVWASTAPELAGRGGLYLEDCHITGPSPDLGSPFGYAPWALDREAAKQLWALSEKRVGASFD